MNPVKFIKPDEDAFLKGPGIIKLVAAEREGISMLPVVSGTVPNIELAIGDCFRMLRKDVVYERQRFEDHMQGVIDALTTQGIKMIDYTPGDNMFWRTQDGRYGIHSLNSVWQGWQAAMNIPTTIKVKG